MKRKFLIMFMSAVLGMNFIMPVAALEDEQLFTAGDVIEVEWDQSIVLEEQPDTIIYSDYVVDINNLYKYNLIALQNADINCHVRGSIWVGGILTGEQYIDDGSLNGQIASESYVFDNQSNIYFQSRTVNQSPVAYKGLIEPAITNSIDYWTQIILSFPQDENFIYVQPDENGYVDLKKWDYQSQGSDELMQEIPKIYWTNATYVEMGGLAGHLIAPYADIHIVSCNHRGSIVGWNIYTDGESHINYWIPEAKGDTPVPTETPVPTSTPTPIPTETPTPVPNKPTPPVIEKETNPPDTGDVTNILGWCALGLISLSAGIYAGYRKKNK